MRSILERDKLISHSLITNIQEEIFGQQGAATKLSGISRRRFTMSMIPDFAALESGVWPNLSCTCICSNMQGYFQCSIFKIDADFARNEKPLQDG
jgi:hypothetical protein